jgi:hypothetical protein
LSLLALMASLTLLDFDDAADLTLWRPVDDVVMGGVSSSGFESAGRGVARFAGTVSLDYGGGFASVRTLAQAWDTAGATAFVLRVQGDGRAYKFTLRTGEGFDGVQYQARFAPPAGEWTEVRLPVGSFVASFRGRPVPGAPPLDPARVRILGLMISDRQAGPFELLVDRIGVER